MIIHQQEFFVNGLAYTVRSAIETDAKALSEIRLQIDGETEHMDRVQGEAFIDASGFEQIIKTDTESRSNLFLIASVQDRITGFSRCVGNPLTRFSHKAEFGICVLKEFWGYGIGKNLMQASISWADLSGIKKISLSVVETNEKAMKLYKKLGFEIEGILKNDRIHSDGKYYNTIMMGRWNE